MKTYIDVSEFPLAISLEENYQQIRNEFYVLSEQYLGTKPNNLRSSGEMLYEGKFTSVFTRVADESCSNSELDSIYGKMRDGKEEALKKRKIKQSLTPVLESCLQPFIEDIGCVGFNVMYPGAKLRNHYGVCSTYVRIHLGIDCDPNAVFYVENLPPRPWKPGKVFAFSDGDAFHGSEHFGISPRTILIVDINKRTFNEFKEDKWITIN